MPLLAADRFVAADVVVVVRPSTSDPPVMVGESPSTHAVRSMIAKLANSRWPVLIQGETGTGKEVAARSIHALSGLSGPFVVIDCSCMGTLMESELFGHVRGAFTGASTSKVGLLEAAHGGTAFFDEIGELPLEAQAKLLRVLQEKEFRPLGALQTRRSEFRIISATNRDLAGQLDAGAFRRDLYFRLNVLPLRMVPLRERREEIPALVNHFLEASGGRHTVSPELMATLLSYSWPGNVRELENCIRQMVVMSLDPLLTSQQLPASIRKSIKVAEPQPAGATNSEQLNALAHSLSEAVLPLVEIERRAILRALDQSGGDRRVAAHLLGIGHTTLLRRLKEYGRRPQGGEPKP